MRISNHICFSVKSRPYLVEELERFQIPYERSDDLMVFDIYEDHPGWNYIKHILDTEKIRCLPTLHFTKDELYNAPWLKVRSKWHNGYPEPLHTVEYQRNAYTSEYWCEKCGVNHGQKNSFCTKNVPKWGNRHFFMMNWLFDELFIDKVAKDIIQRQSIPGVNFRELKRKNNIDVTPNTYQLEIMNILDAGMVLTEDGIASQEICANCGTVKYMCTGRDVLTFRKEIFNGTPDIVKSNEWFGWGIGADRAIIISQRIFRLLEENKLSRSLVFEPIRLV